MSTPNTWGNEYYHRLSQAMTPTPRPLPDDPGPLPSAPREEPSRLVISIGPLGWVGLTMIAIGAGMLMRPFIFDLIWKHTP